MWLAQMEFAEKLFPLGSMKIREVSQPRSLDVGECCQETFRSEHTVGNNVTDLHCIHGFLCRYEVPFGTAVQKLLLENMGWNVLELTDILKY